MALRWKKMKSAPKDGTEFIAVFTEERVWGRVMVIHWLEDESCWWTGGCARFLDDEFKCWTDLPA